MKELFLKDKRKIPKRYIVIGLLFFICAIQVYSIYFPNKEDQRIVDSIRTVEIVYDDEPFLEDEN